MTDLRDRGRRRLETVPRLPREADVAEAAVAQRPHPCRGFLGAHGRVLRGRRRAARSALIGHNGSGKTTMLKVIAGILRPTKGLVRERGRIAGLLELGAGFHPELTGRENVYLNASFLGLSRNETDRVYDDIVGFAELEEFMDTAVKFYSSGMLVRLGFACRGARRAGDHPDRRGARGRRRGLPGSVHRQGAVVPARGPHDRVRHATRSTWCGSSATDAVMLDHGRVHATGAPDDVVREMRLTILHHDLEFAREEGSKEVEIVGVELLRDGVPVTGAVPSGETLTIQCRPARDRARGGPGRVVRAARRHERVRLRRRHHRRRASTSARCTARAASDSRLGPIPVTGGKYWLTLGRALTRQRARLPRPGRALLLRRPAGRRPPRPVDIPRDHADGGPCDRHRAHRRPRTKRKAPDA